MREQNKEILERERSDVAFVLATLILVSVFEPVKARMHSLVDRRVKEQPDNTREWRAFGDDVRCFLDISDPRQPAPSGAVSLRTVGELRTIHTVGRWQGEAGMAVPLACDGQRYGSMRTTLCSATSAVSKTRRIWTACGSVRLPCVPPFPAAA